LVISRRTINGKIISYGILILMIPWILVALSGLKEPSEREILRIRINRIEDNDPYIRHMALYILEQKYLTNPEELKEIFPEHELISMVRKRLDDKSAQIRGLALFVAEAGDMRELIPAVQKKLDDPDEVVRSAARNLLKRWGIEVKGVNSGGALPPSPKEKEPDKPDGK